MNAAIEDFIYSNTSDLQARIDVQKHIAALSAKPSAPPLFYIDHEW